MKTLPCLIAILALVLSCLSQIVAEFFFDLPPCADDWKLQLRRFRRATQYRWLKQPNTRCYDFTLKIDCFFCSQTSYNVSVRRGVVKSPKEDEFGNAIPSMQDIFRTIYNNCFANCPDQGAAVCNVKYAYVGYVQDVYIDLSLDIADEEIHYTISNFKFCSAA